VLRFEARTQEQLNEIQGLVEEMLAAELALQGVQP
jgi:hypothetical protein